MQHFNRPKEKLRCFTPFRSLVLEVYIYDFCFIFDIPILSISLFVFALFQGKQEVLSF